MARSRPAVIGDAYPPLTCNAARLTSHRDHVSIPRSLQRGSTRTSEAQCIRLLHARPPRKKAHLTAFSRLHAASCLSVSARSASDLPTNHSRACDFQLAGKTIRRGRCGYKKNHESRGIYSSRQRRGEGVRAPKRADEEFPHDVGLLVTTKRSRPWAPAGSAGPGSSYDVRGAQLVFSERRRSKRFYSKKPGRGARAAGLRGRTKRAADGSVAEQRLSTC